MGEKLRTLFHWSTIYLFDSYRASLALYRRIWHSNSSGNFTCKSYYQLFIHFPLVNIWKLKGSWAKAFVWSLVLLHNINNNDMLHVQRWDKSLALDVSVRCPISGETLDHLFSHVEYRIFSIFSEQWVRPQILAFLLLIHFLGFGTAKGGKAFWDMRCLQLFYLFWGREIQEYILELLLVLSTT